MDKKELKEHLQKMNLTIKYIQNCVDNNFNIRQHYEASKINPIVVRNVSYVNAIVERVNENINYINKLDKTKKENTALIKKKALINIILLKHICDLSKNLSIDKQDFEIENLLMHKGLPSFISKITKNIDKEVNDNIEEEIRDEFETVKKNNKIIEGFNLSSIGNFFKKIANGFKSIIKGIVKIGKFLGNFLYKFIMFFWKILKFIFELVTKIIPKLIVGIFNFIKLFIIKFFRVGFFCIILLGIFIIGFYKYWQILMEINNTPLPLVFPPAIIIVAYLFWYQTDILYKIQVAIIRGFIWSLTSVFKGFIVFVLGLPKNHRFFRYKGRNVIIKTKLLFLMILTNLPFMIARFFIALLAMKYMVKYGTPKIVSQIPSFRELILFPPIMIRYMYRFVIKIYKYFLMKSE